MIRQGSGRGAGVLTGQKERINHHGGRLLHRFSMRTNTRRNVLVFFSVPCLKIAAIFARHPVNALPSPSLLKMPDALAPLAEYFTAARGDCNCLSVQVVRTHPSSQEATKDCSSERAKASSSTEPLELVHPFFFFFFTNFHSHVRRSCPLKVPPSWARPGWE